MKAKCAHCGKELEQEASENWKLYCTDVDCSKAFMAEAIANATKKRGGKRG